MQSVLAASRFQTAQIPFLGTYRTAATSNHKLCGCPIPKLSDRETPPPQSGILPLHESTTRFLIGSVVFHEHARDSCCRLAINRPSLSSHNPHLESSARFQHLIPPPPTVHPGDHAWQPSTDKPPRLAICRCCSSIPGALAPERLVTGQDIG